MIHAHLKRIALELDEENYRVQLPEEVSNANDTFQDGDGVDPLWITKVWRQLFKAKLSYLGYEIVKDTKILDVCCGQGFLGESLMEEAGGGCDLLRSQPTATGCASQKIQFAKHTGPGAAGRSHGPSFCRWGI